MMPIQPTVLIPTLDIYFLIRPSCCFPFPLLLLFGLCYYSFLVSLSHYSYHLRILKTLVGAIMVRDVFNVTSFSFLVFSLPPTLYRILVHRESWMLFLWTYALSTFIKLVYTVMMNLLWQNAPIWYYSCHYGDPLGLAIMKLYLMAIHYNQRNWSGDSMVARTSSIQTLVTTCKNACTWHL